MSTLTAELPKPYSTTWNTPYKTAQALGLAVIIELLILFAVLFTIARMQQPEPKYTEPVKLAIVSEPTPPKPVVQPKPTPPTPKPKPVVRQITHPRPVVLPPPPKPETTPTPLPKADTPTAFTAPTPPPPPPPQPSVASNNNAVADYRGAVHTAVQTAVYYPPAAAVMHFSGQVKVEFHLYNTVSSQARVIVSSDLSIIDHAALQAVQSAQYPTPPEKLRDKDQVYQVWVALTLTHDN